MKLLPVKVQIAQSLIGSSTLNFAHKEVTNHMKPEGVRCPSAMQVKDWSFEIVNVVNGPVPAIFRALKQYTTICTPCRRRGEPD